MSARSLDRFRPKARQKIDFWILLSVLAIVAFGLIMVSSASVVVSYQNYGSNYYFLIKQAWAALAGFVGLIIFTMIDYRFWQRIAPWIGGALILSLIIPHIPGVGSSALGAQRWVYIGGVSLQFSEPVKIFSILYFAAWLAARENQIEDFKATFIPFVVSLGVIMLAIILQPDAGTAITLGLVLVAMYFAAGAKPLFMGYLAGLGSLGVFAILQSPYRAQRLLTFLDPSKQTLGAGYHINQALLAIGSGGWFGLGFGKSIQKYLFLPEVQTDSIFAISTEELGFLRMMFVLAVFGFFINRGYLVARRAPDRFGQLVAFGITTLFAVQLFVNIGAMLDIMPLTGVTMPLISYGGSSLMTMLAAVGILLSISKHAEREVV